MDKPKAITIFFISLLLHASYLFHNRRLIVRGMPQTSSFYQKVRLLQIAIISERQKFLKVTVKSSGPNLLLI